MPEATTPLPERSGHGSLDRRELAALVLILSSFVALAANAVSHGTTYGQDFPLHEAETLKFQEGPRWFFLDPTSRPLLYAVGSLCLRLAGASGFALASYVFVALAVVALCLLHDALRSFVDAPVVRLSAIALIAFLPVTVVTTVVYASDALALLPFALTAWSLLRCLTPAQSRETASAALVCCIALCLGNLAKATFMPLPLGVAAVLALQVRRGALTARQALRIGAITVAIPLAFGFWLSSKAKAAEASAPARHTFDWKGTGEMTVGSLLLPKAGDLRILQAPTYFPTPDPNSRERTLVTTDNALSYPALLHLGVFSDVMNLAGNNVVNRTARPPRQATASRLGVAWGVVTSVATLVVLLGLTASIARGLLNPAVLPGLGQTIFVILGSVWYLPLVVILPFVHHAYEWGYWLPRLVLPAVWVFFLLGASGACAALPARGRLVGTILIGLQIAAFVASLWY